MEIRNTLLYTENHEWVKIEGEYAYIGITDYAQHELGDIVFVELPDLDIHINVGDPLGSLEAVKTVEDIYMPISGEVKKVNMDLADSPELINKSPYDDGWLIKIRVTDKEEIQKLLNAEEYQKLVESK